MKQTYITKQKWNTDIEEKKKKNLVVTSWERKEGRGKIEVWG